MSRNLRRTGALPGFPALGGIPLTSRAGSISERAGRNALVCTFGLHVWMLLLRGGTGELEQGCKRQVGDSTNGPRRAPAAVAEPCTDRPQQHNHDTAEQARLDHRWASLATVPTRKPCSQERTQLLTPVTCSIRHTIPVSLVALLTLRLPIPTTSSST